MVMDEFRGGIPLHVLNHLVDGTTVRIHMRGASMIKKRNIPMIIATNFELHQLYPNCNPDQLAPTQARFIFYNVKSFIGYLCDNFKFE